MSPEKVLTNLTDIEDCAVLAIKAHDKQRYDHVIHYLMAIRKAIKSVNIEIEMLMDEDPRVEGCSYSSVKPSLDDYENRNG